MKTRRIVMLAGIAGLAAGCSSPAESREGEGAVAMSRAAAVRLDRTTVEDSYEAVGTVQSRRTTTLASRVLGDVAAVHVREGDPVRAGQALVEIDARDLFSQLRRAEASGSEARAALAETDHAIRAGESAKTAAEANLRLASATLDRFMVLRDRNSVSPQEFDEVKTRHESAAAELARAKAALEAQVSKRQQVLARIEQAHAGTEAAKIAVGYARIEAPFAGVVTSAPVEVGSQAAPGAPLLSIEDRSYEIETLIPESRVGEVLVGKVVGVDVAAAGLSGVEGRISALLPAADVSTRSYVAKVSLPGSATDALRSGMFARVRIPSGERDIVAIPSDAIVVRGQLTGVFVVDESDTIRLRLIQAGQRYGDNVEILSGVDAGERVVVKVDATVKDGARWEP